MTKKIYFQGFDEDTAEVCEVQDLLPDLEECGDDASYMVEDTVTGIQTQLCAFHKDAVKAAGVAQ